MITGLVYKDKSTYWKISFFTERKKTVDNEDVFDKVDNGNPLPSTSISLINYEKELPIAVIDLTKDGKKIDSNRIDFDDLISVGYTAAKQYLDSKKSN